MRILIFLSFMIPGLLTAAEHGGSAAPEKAKQEHGGSAAPEKASEHGGSAAPEKATSEHGGSA
ncbi:MAG: hypothetical protein ACPG4A_12435, partial [Pseudomonadales bacterium]